MTDPASPTPLKLFNSLTRSFETFEPIHAGEARVYSCGPTVYNYQHVGNMRAYVFADTLGRVLSFKGYKLSHVINITDVGHLTSDADAGDDKMETAASREGKSAWDIARHYQSVFEADLARLNVRKPQILDRPDLSGHPRATDYVAAMIAWGQAIEAKHCYRLGSGLYFDVSTVPDYGRLARASTDEGANELGGRIESVEGKRHAADFAIWRTTPPGETRQMEWDSPWGRGAPGWHIECSVMSAELLGHPFDIHTGGIDHREIHHPNEIAQNQAMYQAHGSGPDTGARIWMHNNFLIDRRGKMSKSSGDFLTLQALVDRGFHPLAFRMLCLQAHYRSELEFSWEGLAAAFKRRKRLIRPIAELASYAGNTKPVAEEKFADNLLTKFSESIFQDLNTPEALTYFEALALSGAKIVHINNPENLELVEAICAHRISVLKRMDQVLGLKIFEVGPEDLRIRPITVTITEPEIEAKLAARKEARAAKDFAKSDALRDELAAQGVEVMDGDPLGWDWKLEA